MDGLEGISGLVVFGAGTFPTWVGVGNIIVGALVDEEGGNGKSSLRPPSGRGGSEWSVVPLWNDK
jgi:hypothetical protein